MDFDQDECAAAAIAGLNATSHDNRLLAVTIADPNRKAHKREAENAVRAARGDKNVRDSAVPRTNAPSGVRHKKLIGGSSGATERLAGDADAEPKSDAERKPKSQDDFRRMLFSKKE